MHYPSKDQWNNKVTEKSDCLVSMCRDENIPSINQTKVIDPRKKSQNCTLIRNALLKYMATL